MAVGCDHLGNPQRRGATLGPQAAERYVITRLEGFPRPPRSHQVIGAGELPLPFLDIALVVFGFKENQDMRIYKLKLRDRGLERQGFRCVVCGVAVMCE